MVTVDRAIIAKLQRNGKEYEILVDPDVVKFIGKKEISISNALVLNEIFHDAKKGLRVSPAELRETFGVDDVFSVAEIILKEGEIQMTTQMIREKTEEMRNRIIDFISKNAMDPATKLPHPPKRIELAMEQAHVHVDIKKSFEENLKKAINSIKVIIPLSFEKISLEIIVPAKYSAQAYGVIKKNMTDGKLDWRQDGSLYARINVTSGIKTELYSKLGSITHGEVEIKERGD